MIGHIALDKQCKYKYIEQIVQFIKKKFVLKS